MYYKALVKCEHCGAEAWVGFYDHEKCCESKMTPTGHEKYDIHGAIWLAGIRQVQMLRQGVAQTA